jgi:hypothetical protein
MPPLAIPEDDRGAFTALAKAGDAELEAVLSALGNLREATISRGQLVTAVASTWGGDLAEDLVGALLSLQMFGSWKGWTVERTGQEAGESRDLSLSANERQSLASRVTALLATQPLVTVARAVDLMRESERTFLNARILSDLRPLFGETTDVRGAILMHTLRIDYEEDDDVASFFVTLTSDELEDLFKVVSRAMDKTKTLTEFAGRSGLPLFDVYRDDQP